MTNAECRTNDIREHGNLFSSRHILCPMLFHATAIEQCSHSHLNQTTSTPSILTYFIHNLIIRTSWLYRESHSYVARHLPSAVSNRLWLSYCTFCSYHPMKLNHISNESGPMLLAIAFSHFLQQTSKRTRHEYNRDIVVKQNSKWLTVFPVENRPPLLGYWSPCRVYSLLHLNVIAVLLSNWKFGNSTIDFAAVGCQSILLLLFYSIYCYLYSCLLLCSSVQSGQNVS